MTNRSCAARVIVEPLTGERYRHELRPLPLLPSPRPVTRGGLPVLQIAHPPCCTARGRRGGAPRGRPRREWLLVVELVARSGCWPGRRELSRLDPRLDSRHEHPQRRYVLDANVDGRKLLRVGAVLGVVQHVHTHILAGDIVADDLVQDDLVQNDLVRDDLVELGALLGLRRRSGRCRRRRLGPRLRPPPGGRVGLALRRPRGVAVAQTHARRERRERAAGVTVGPGVERGVERIVSPVGHVRAPLRSVSCATASAAGGRGRPRRRELRHFRPRLGNPMADASRPRLQSSSSRPNSAARGGIPVLRGEPRRSRS